MQPLQHTAGPDSDSHKQSDDWDFKSTYKEQVKKANAVPITFILKSYGLKLEQHTKSLPCPFAKRHKNGQDRSPSFNIYVNTNSFWCFGCKTGNSCVDFVSNMDNIKYWEAAEKILSIYNGDISLLEINNNNDYFQRLELLIEFANYIREIMINTTNEDTILFLEEVCAALDSLNSKYKNNMDNDTLLSILDRLRKKVEQHIKCQ